MSKFSVFIFFCIMQLCNTSVAMELTEQQKKINNSAKFFIQKFPHMTLNKTKNVFDTLQPTVKSAIWDKLNQDKENKVLSAALILALLPSDLQNKVIPITSPDELQSIKIMWLPRKIEVDQQCKKNNFLRIELVNEYSQFGNIEISPYRTIEIPKSILFSLTNEHIEVVQKAQNATILTLTKKQLILLNEFFNSLPNNLQKELESFFAYPSYDGTNKQINFHYREGKLTIGQKSLTMAKNGFNACKAVLPYIILPLLYTHFFIKPTWDSIISTQNSLQLEQNIKFEAANKTIENLKKLNIDGCEHLIKHIINKVPFTYSWSDWSNFAKPLLPKALLYHSFLIYNVPTFYNGDMRLSWRIELNCEIYIVALMIAAITSLMLKDFFAEGVPIALTCITCTVGLCGIIIGRADSYKWKLHSIDLNNESIEQFLNDPSIEIRENLNE